MKNFALTLAALAVLTLLNGCVAAVVAAGAAATTSGVVVSQERSVGNAVDDTTIWTQIKHLYLQQETKDLLIGVGVEVIEGRVYLTGNVEETQSRIDAVRLAWQPKGVKEVINDVQIITNRSLLDSVKDTWILSQLNTKLALISGIKSLNYSTEVVDSTVYIMGISQSQDEYDRVEEIARTISGVKKVVNHATLRDIVERY